MLNIYSGLTSHCIVLLTLARKRERMNEFDHQIFAVLKQQLERPENFRPEKGFEP